MTSVSSKRYKRVRLCRGVCVLWCQRLLLFCICALLLVCPTFPLLKMHRLKAWDHSPLLALRRGLQRGEREREGGRGDGGFKGRDNLETSSVEDRQLWTLFLQKVRSIQGRNLELVQLSVTQLSVWSLMVYFDSCMCCFGFWNDGFVLVSGLDWVWFVCVLIGISGTYLLRRIGICIFVYFRSPPELQKNSLL